jgi:hypothetical protein
MTPSSRERCFSQRANCSEIPGHDNTKGEHAEDFSEWAGFYKVKQRREEAFRRLCQKRLEKMRALAPAGPIRLEPQEPVIEVV